MIVGVDVGGTNTDAVLMDGSELLAQAKFTTTSDVTSGIVSALAEVLRYCPDQSRIRGVMLGTTHFINALLERRELSPTAVLRLALPATRLLPPLVDWPPLLKQVVGGITYMVHGGHEFDGREISPLEAAELRETVQDMRQRGVRAVAVCGVFSPVNPQHEREAAALIAQEAPELKVTLSHENGRIGILERENAATLNAALLETAEGTIKSIESALQSLGLEAPLYLTQNDGTLMDTSLARRFPVYTIASGPTNSMRGAAFLSGVPDGIVVDLGGSSTDVGALVRGFPREASVAVKIAGVRTNFRMPDVLSIALGGGSRVQQDPPQVEPVSVGYRLTQESLVFGGDTLTATDIAVAGGMAQVGNPELIRHLEASVVAGIKQQILQKVEDAVDQVKISAAPVPVILVGGGSILLGDSIQGASQVLRPEHSDVANAIGAAIAQVGGQVEQVYSAGATSRQEALAAARKEAVDRAVAAGADPVTVQIVEVDEIPMTYLPSNATLIRVKAAGDLAQH
ncbi:MAG: hydantoinase/oxoprolinase N-terminal domain-containing protein [Dehalococcoidia bacterium]